MKEIIAAIVVIIGIIVACNLWGSNDMDTRII